MLAPVLAQFHGKALLVNDKAWACGNELSIYPQNYGPAVFLQTDSPYDTQMLRGAYVCHRFNDIIEGSVELQYRIELTVDGMIDGPPSSLSIGERLTRLRALRRSWATLQWTSKITLVGGVHRYSSRHLTCGGQMLVRDDVGLPTRDFAVDPSQDLIIYFRGNDIDALPALVAPGAVELHVHPDARSATLRMPVLLPVTNAFMQIVDDIVGMLYFIEPERPHITLWNWKTGKVVVVLINLLSTFPPNTWDFSFISNRAFFIHYPAQIQCNPCCLFAPPPTLPHIRVVNLSTHTGPFLARPPSGRPFVAANEERTHVFSVQYVNPNPDANSTLEKYIKKHQSRSWYWCTVGKGLTGPLVVPWEAWGRDNTRFMVHHWNQFEWLRYVHGHRVVLPAPRNGRAMMYVLDFNVHDTVRQNQYYRVDDGDTTDTSKADAISVGAPPTPKPKLYRMPTVGHSEEEELDNTGEDDDGTGCLCAGSAADNIFQQATNLLCTNNDFRQRNTGSKRASLVTEPSVEEYPLFFSAPFETALPYRELQHEQEERIVGLEYPAFLNGDMKDIHVFTM
ncbi:hypothetical protein BKA82DRAFT_4178295 [Pisolithus tinctorius]|nr:hypothetical protein BKA82DRAFT_4178295 [Pisolithus tinctorius]